MVHEGIQGQSDVRDTPAPNTLSYYVSSWDTRLTQEARAYPGGRMGLGTVRVMIPNGHRKPSLHAEHFSPRVLVNLLPKDNE